MIEKLERHTRIEKGLTKDIKISCPSEQSEMASKINELVDAVNELQKQYDNVCIWVGEQKLKTPAENVQDEFAEQRKWIGKLCRFWDVDGGGKCFSILKEIGNSNTIQVWRDGAFRAGNDYWYEHCELVKPDDDIIYKGE